MLVKFYGKKERIYKKSDFVKNFVLIEQPACRRPIEFWTPKLSKETFRNDLVEFLESCFFFNCIVFKVYLSVILIVLF